MELRINSKPLSNRQYMIWKLERDWPALRYGLRNGRKLNRLSNRQLEAKLAQHERMMSKQRGKYVNFLNSFQAA
jgi:hypothetical protein